MFTQKVISYKEYKAWKEVEQGASAADKSTPEGEEDWDAKPTLPPQNPPPGASSMAPSQEDEWKMARFGLLTSLGIPSLDGMTWGAF